MSTTYRAGFVPDDKDGLIAFLREELARIEAALNAPQPFAELQVLHAQPEKLRAGMLVYVDGTDWNPGSGEGVYRRSADNTTWDFLG